jgi:hypothetical protein
MILLDTLRYSDAALYGLHSPALSLCAQFVAGHMTPVRCSGMVCVAVWAGGGQRCAVFCRGLMLMLVLPLLMLLSLRWSGSARVGG